MFRFTVRNMLGNATSQDVMNFRTVIEGRNSNHVDQSRDFKVLQTPQPVPAKSQKRWNIGKINTYIIYTAYTYSYYVLTWLILEWNKKLNWDRCKISHFLKQPSGGFLKFVFFCDRHNFSQYLCTLRRTFTELKFVYVVFLSMQAVISCFSREPEKYVTCLGQ